jgi:hypothetical protein
VYDLTINESDSLGGRTGRGGKAREIESEGSAALEGLSGIKSVGAGEGMLANNQGERCEEKFGFEGSNNR